MVIHDGGDAGEEVPSTPATESSTPRAVPSILGGVPSTPRVEPSGSTVVPTTPGWVPNTPVAEPRGLAVVPTTPRLELSTPAVVPITPRVVMSGPRVVPSIAARVPSTPVEQGTPSTPIKCASPPSDITEFVDTFHESEEVRFRRLDDIIGGTGPSGQASRLLNDAELLLVSTEEPLTFALAERDAN